MSWSVFINKFTSNSGQINCGYNNLIKRYSKMTFDRMRAGTSTDDRRAEQDLAKVVVIY